LSSTWLKFKKFREQNLRLSRRFKAQGYEHDSERLKKCGSSVTVKKCGGCGQDYFATYVDSCENNFCYICSYKKMLVWLKVSVPVIEVYQARKKKIILLTLTLKNQPDVRAMMDKLNSSFKLLLKRKIFTGLIGGILSREVAGRKGKWHVHAHGIVIADDYIDQANLSLIWRQITGNSYIVGLSLIRGKKGIIEAMKYPFKFNDFDDDSLGEILRLKGRRMRSTFGQIRKEISAQKIKQSEEDCLQKSLDLETFVCKKCGCTSAELRTIFYNDNLNLL